LAQLHAGPRLIAVAIIGALVISLLAKWAPVIRGHGIPEAMEAVLVKQSRIAPRTAIAKPLSAAVAIGTGAPFGAEGPIIVTGGSLGSLLGQVVRVSPAERQILLACGAAAGMSATFGAPLASVVLATELLLFEFSARALVPLAVATSVGPRCTERSTASVRCSRRRCMSSPASDRFPPSPSSAWRAGCWRW
jgi:H+/Cl- antiporter ClcA